MSNPRFAGSCLKNSPGDPEGWENEPMVELPDRNIVSRVVDGQSVLTVIGVVPGQRGPWPVVTGIFNGEADMPGPPPAYLSVAAWAA